MAPARALGVLTIARCHLPRQHENVINGDRSVITRTAARRRRRRGLKWGEETKGASTVSVHRRVG